MTSTQPTDASPIRGRDRIGGPLGLNAGQPPTSMKDTIRAPSASERVVRHSNRGYPALALGARIGAA